MSNIWEGLRRNKHVFALSVCSALLVVTLQVVANHFFPMTTNTAQFPVLDTAVGEIIPITQGPPIVQLKSTLQKDELIEFQTNGQLEDKHASEQVKGIAISFETLFVSLDDDISYSQRQTAAKDVRVKISNNQNVNLSICTQDNQYKKSCMMYLVNKAGESVPVSVTMSDLGIGGESIITLRQSKSVGGDTNIYTAKPVQIDIRAIGG